MEGHPVRTEGCYLGRQSCYTWKSKEAVNAGLCSTNRAICISSKLCFLYSTKNFLELGFQGFNEALGKAGVSMKASPPIREQSWAPETDDVFS